MHTFTASVIPIAVFAVLLFSTVFMGYLLRKSMKKTVYSYTNISLIGGILFASVLLLIHTHFCLTVTPEQSGDPEYIYKQILAFPRVFSYYAVFVITLVCILLGISNIALIRHEGFCLHNALALLVAALYIGGTAAVYLIADHLISDVFTPLGLYEKPVFVVIGTVLPLFLLLMLCYFECILAGSGILGWIAARKVPAYDKDYIIILGCSIDKRGGLLPLLKGRVNRAIRFAWEQEIATGKPLKYVPSGGQGPNEIMSEGSAMNFYLLTHGAEDYEVYPEKESRNTLENFKCSLKIINELKPDAKIAFATTNYHILRSGILAREAGIDAEGIAGDTKWYFWPNGFVREFFGILVMKRKAHLVIAAAVAVISCLIGLAEYIAFTGRLG